MYLYTTANVFGGFDYMQLTKLNYMIQDVYVFCTSWVWQLLEDLVTIYFVCCISAISSDTCLHLLQSEQKCGIICRKNPDFNLSGGCSPICLRIVNNVYINLYDFK